MIPGDDPLERFRQAYITRETPWDSGVPSSELVRVLDAGLLPGHTVLELGCGTGTNAIEFARRGYKVTALDLIDLPIERAKEKARQAGVQIDFRVGDLTKTELGGPYEVLFDLGLYHGLRTRDLPGLLKTIERVSRRWTRWLSLAGNAREPLPNGPPVVREEEFRAELGTLFQFLEVREFRFELREDFRPLAWSILMERR